jgi:hypothetical protein
VLLDSITQAAAFYLGPADQEPSLAFSLARFNDFRAYYADPSSPAVFGSSNDLPPRWPYPGISGFEWFNDATPNKLRFSDLDGLWSTLWVAIIGAFDSATTDTINTNITSADAGVIAMTAPQWPSLNRRFATMLRGAMPPINTSALPSKLASASTDDLANLTLTGWATYLYKSVRSCSFREELDGSQKRFSIGESALIMGAVGASVGAIVTLPFIGFGLTTVGAAAGSASLAMVLGTLVVSYSWSYRCTPAFPYGLGDDVTWFATRTLWPRADWFWAGILNGDSITGADTYTSAASVVCSNYLDGTFTAGWCYGAPDAGGLGFADLGYNLVFILGQVWPAALTYLATTRVPLLQQLVAIPIVNGYLDAFSGFDATDPVQYSQHWQCATTWTAVANVIIAVAYFYVIWKLAGPLVRMFATLLAQALWPVALAGMLELHLLFAMLEGPSPSPSLPAADAEQHAALSTPARGEPLTRVGRFVAQRGLEPLAARLGTHLQHAVDRLHHRLERARAARQGGAAADEHELLRVRV